MKRMLPVHLSRRERQILDVLYRLGRANAADIRRELPDPPSYSAVRAMLRILEDKGHVRHIEEGLRYMYMPVVSRDRVRHSALRYLVETFFGGSPAEAATALLDSSAGKLSELELERLSEMIRKAKQERG
ncbi:MAG TPA: BlaI/MecI/CopY family transcriptional regulator [Terriglobales bacterium]|jgi:BlaI family penicillinase repressor|nr:BlaI/MecI/CopY family transcriptional regulator [Terriglobales bacterium]